MAVGSLIKRFFFMSQQEPQRTGDVLEIMSERGGGKELRGTLSPHQEAISLGGGVGREERSQAQWFISQL